MPQRMCPQCQALISSADRVCPYCERELAPAPPPIQRRRSGGMQMPGWLPQAHSTTFIFMLMNVGLFAVSMLYQGPESLGMGFDGNVLTSLGAMRFELIQFRGEWWRLITAGFLHGGLMHILMNMLGLYQLGNEVEGVFETHRYVVIYIVSTITGFYASFVSGNILSIGASAGIFGLLGALIAHGVLQRSSLGQEIKQYYVRMAVYSLMIGVFLSQSMGGRTDNAAHIGGLAGGFGVAYLAGLPSLFDNWKERLWQGVCWFCVALVVLSYVIWARNYVL